MEQATVLSGQLLPHQSALAMAVMHGARKQLQATLQRFCGTVPVTLSTIHSFSLKIANRWRRSLGFSLPITICKSSCGLAEVDGRTHATFNEVMQLACRLLGSATVCDTIASSHPFVIVDEFQDCTGDTLQFVQALGNSAKLLLAADHFQLLSDSGNGCPAVDWVVRLRAEGGVDCEELAGCNRTNEPVILRAARALRDNVKAALSTVPVYYGHTAPQVACRIVERFSGWGGTKRITDGTCALVVLSMDDIQVTQLLNSFHTQLEKKTACRINWSFEWPEKQNQAELFKELGITTSSTGNHWSAKKTTLSRQASRVSEEVLRFCKLRGIREIPQDLVSRFAELEVHNARAFSKSSPRFQVLTVHAAKNREFDHVFVFWSYKRLGWPVEEQRRLLYNAVTRAKVDCTVLFLGDAAKAQADPVIDLLGPARPAMNPQWGKKKKANYKT
jgi:hypothetical protein